MGRSYSASTRQEICTDGGFLQFHHVAPYAAGCDARVEVIALTMPGPQPVRSRARFRTGSGHRTRRGGTRGEGGRLLGPDRVEVAVRS
jgi:hypothetical protein